MTARSFLSDHPRKRRIFRADGKALIVAMDHASFMDTGRSLRYPGRAIRDIVAGGADALIASFGLASRFGACLGRAGLILRVDGGPTMLSGGEGGWPLLHSAEDALRLGADGVVCMGFPGARGEGETLANLARLASDCRKWGLFLLAEMIPGGFGRPELHTPENVARAARIGAEAGADAIKTAWTGSRDSFRGVARGCYRPVLARGGEWRESEAEVLAAAADAADAGGAGLAIGRNVWQRPDPGRFTAALCRAVHGGAPARKTPAEDAGRDPTAVRLECPSP